MNIFEDSNQLMGNLKYFLNPLDPAQLAQILFEIHFVERHHIEAELFLLSFLAEVVENYHAIVNDLRHCWV